MSLQLVKEAPKESLLDRAWLENVICGCGLATVPEELPLEMRQFKGGMEIWQHPCQLAPYLIWLSDKRIESYVEIGIHKGGTFAFTVTYLNRFHTVRDALGIDPQLHPIIGSYDFADINTRFLQVRSESDEAREAVAALKPDLVFVDAVHTDEAVRQDYEISKGARFVAFHDICDWHAPGVQGVWRALTGNKVEFTDQYDGTRQDLYGIGVLS